MVKNIDSNGNTKNRFLKMYMTQIRSKNGAAATIKEEFWTTLLFMYSFNVTIYWLRACLFMRLHHFRHVPCFLLFLCTIQSDRLTLEEVRKSTKESFKHDSELFDCQQMNSTWHDKRLEYNTHLTLKKIYHLKFADTGRPTNCCCCYSYYYHY